MSKRVLWEDFKQADGSTDWRAYNAAKLANGERCRTCDAGIFPVFSEPVGYPTECNDCKALTSDAGEVSHDELIRCPKCRDTWSPRDSEDYDAYSDGEHELTCDDCGHRFTISTHVSFSFESPPLIDAATPPERAK